MKFNEDLHNIYIWTSSNIFNFVSKQHLLALEFISWYLKFAVVLISIDLSVRYSAL
jgi:hypothetical protein